MGKKDDLNNLTIEELKKLLEEKQNMLAQEEANKKSEEVASDEESTISVNEEYDDDIIVEEEEYYEEDEEDDSDYEDDIEAFFAEESEDDEEVVEEVVEAPSPKEDKSASKKRGKKKTEEIVLEPIEEDSEILSTEKKQIKSNVSAGKKYLQQSFVSDRMKGYSEEVWETAEADFHDLRRGTYPHVFSSKAEVSFKNNDKFEAHLDEYRNKEDAIAEKYKKNYSVIKSNSKKHTADLAQCVDEKIKRGRRKGTLMSWLSMIIGVASGAALAVFAGPLAMLAQEELMLSAYAFYIIACFLGLGLAGFSLVFNVLFLIIGHKKKKSGKKKEGVIVIEDPVTWKKIKHKCKYAPQYKGRLWTSFIVLILVLAVGLTGGYLFLKGFTAGEYNLSDEGYLFSLSFDNEDLVARIEGVKSFPDSEESSSYPGYYEVVVPEKVTLNGTEYDVVGLGANAFRGNEAIISLTIGDNIRLIEQGALSGCKNLQKLVFEDNLDNVSNSSISRFFGATKYDGDLNESTIRSYIPKSLKIVEYSNARTSLSSTCSIPSEVFANLIDVQKITVKTYSANTFIYVGENAYANCRSLKKLDLPCSADFGYGALYGCTGLEELTVQSLTNGGTYVSGLAYFFGGYEVPESLKKVFVEGNVGSYAFFDCVGLRVVDCRNADTIGEYAFGNCTSLVEVVYKEDCDVSSTAFSGSALDSNRGA